jgi:hypothetical protein
LTNGSTNVETLPSPAVRRFAARQLPRVPEVVDHGGTAQVEEVLAGDAARPPELSPMVDVGQGVLDGPTWRCPMLSNQDTIELWTVTQLWIPVHR